MKEQLVSILINLIKKGLITETANILFGVLIIIYYPKILKAMDLYIKNLTQREIFYFLPIFLVGSIIVVIIIHKPF